MDEHEAKQQLAWVDAARRFKQAAIDMEGLWADLDETAQSEELPEDYAFHLSFDELGIGGWLYEGKLNEIERRANAVLVSA